MRVDFFIVCLHDTYLDGTVGELGERRLKLAQVRRSAVLGTARVETDIAGGIVNETLYECFLVPPWAVERPPPVRVNEAPRVIAGLGVCPLVRARLVVALALRASKARINFFIWRKRVNAGDGLRGAGKYFAGRVAETQVQPEACVWQS